ncbi:putative peptidoglycan binding protein [Natranaerovirga pectinivora]|uniref:Putative peptidoglycan binding protein n=1 Tax=Natranaerovirga pectinivora TaxID=682400 RepID=A0A4V2V0I9_9FIRM|nr:L,D-transpeptidase family protein [Natranaerovirga pectinivora]TCT16277.1 putative peptidoglycan binding protein [Natranaerovirga pectinivora]
MRLRNILTSKPSKSKIAKQNLLLLKVLSLMLALLFFNFLSIKYTSNGLAQVFKMNYQESNPYYIIVDLDDYTVNVFKDNELYKQYLCSGGKYSTPSPIGTWSIISKADWGEGFGGTWMGFNVPWGKYGFHGTDEPWSIGHPGSEGCIRMYNEDAADLKSYIPHGTKVKIIKGPYGPFGSGFRTIRPGHIGSDVYAVQMRLKELGYYQGWVDGKYGQGFHNAINKFQKDHNLPESQYITGPMYKAMGFELFE